MYKERKVGCAAGPEKRPLYCRLQRYRNYLVNKFWSLSQKAFSSLTHADYVGIIKIRKLKARCLLSLICPHEFDH